MIKAPSEYYPCNCLKPQEYRDQDNSDIIFCPKSSMFSIEFKGDQGLNKYTFMFCPFCGGKMPTYRYVKQEMHEVSDFEIQRLNNLVSAIKTLEDAFQILAVPEIDRSSLIYKNLSDEADIFISNFKSVDESDIQINIFPKTYTLSH